MICYVLAMGKQHLEPHVVVGYGIKIFVPGLFVTSTDHLDGVYAINWDDFHRITYGMSQIVHYSVDQHCCFGYQVFLVLGVIL